MRYLSSHHTSILHLHLSLVSKNKSVTRVTVSVHGSPQMSNTDKDTWKYSHIDSILKAIASSGMWQRTKAYTLNTCNYDLDPSTDWNSGAEVNEYSISTGMPALTLLRYHTLNDDWSHCR